MKNLKLFMFAFLAAGSFALTSCSDDDGDNGPAPTLEGRWFHSQQGFSVGGNEQLSNYQGHQTGCTKDHIDLVAGGEFKDVMYFENCEEQVTTTTWSVNNNMVTIGTGEDMEVYEILSLDNNNLKVGVPSVVNGVTFYDIETFTRN